MSNLDYENKKANQRIMNFSGLQISTIDRISQTIGDNAVHPIIQRANYDPSLNFGTWRVVYATPLSPSLKKESIDPELQKLSQKVMKKTWDNKEDEFWNTY